MKPSGSLGRFLASLLLFLLVALGLAYGFRQDRSRAADSRQAERDAGPAAVYRCHACAHGGGKAWTSCKSVMARATSEQAVLDLLKRRLAEDLHVPSDSVALIRPRCREIPPDQVPNQRRVRVSGH